MKPLKNMKHCSNFLGDLKQTELFRVAQILCLCLFLGCASAVDDSSALSDPNGGPNILSQGTAYWVFDDGHQTGTFNLVSDQTALEKASNDNLLAVAPPSFFNHVLGSTITGSVAAYNGAGTYYAAHDKTVNSNVCLVSTAGDFKNVVFDTGSTSGYQGGWDIWSAQGGAGKAYFADLNQEGDSSCSFIVFYTDGSGTTDFSFQWAATGDDATTPITIDSVHNSLADDYPDYSRKHVFAANSNGLEPDDHMQQLIITGTGLTAVTEVAVGPTTGDMTALGIDSQTSTKIVTDYLTEDGTELSNGLIEAGYGLHVRIKAGTGWEKWYKVKEGNVYFFEVETAPEDTGNDFAIFVVDDNATNPPFTGADAGACPTSDFDAAVLKEIKSPPTLVSTASTSYALPPEETCIRKTPAWSNSYMASYRASCTAIGGTADGDSFSEHFGNNYSYDGATTGANGCDNLTESGHSNWALPNQSTLEGICNGPIQAARPEYTAFLWYWTTTASMGNQVTVNLDTCATSLFSTMVDTARFTCTTTNAGSALTTSTFHVGISVDQVAPQSDGDSFRIAAGTDEDGDGDIETGESWVTTTYDFLDTEGNTGVGLFANVGSQTNLATDRTTYGSCAAGSLPLP